MDIWGKYSASGMWYSPTMRMLFVADGRSPTTQSWLKHWITSHHEVHLISTYPCESIQGLSSFMIMPVAFSGLAQTTARSEENGTKKKNNIIAKLRSSLRILRYYLGPLSLLIYRPKFNAKVKEINPDLIHALRIPFEGMLASTFQGNTPLAVSIWGNDLTLHAGGSIFMRSLTCKTLKRASALMADTRRDIELGIKMGFDPKRTSLVVPGGGGVHLDVLSSDADPVHLPGKLPDGPVIVNPRGARPGSLRQDNFLRSIPLVVHRIPKAVFVCPALANDPEMENLVGSLGIQGNTFLWPRLSGAQMRALFKKSDVYVSPSIHDGTPNSLLEAMTYGCFPVVGNIESMKEWIIPGVNGLLVDSDSPSSIADGIITAITDPGLRENAKKENARIIAARAEYSRCMAMTEAFYAGVMNK